MALLELYTNKNSLYILLQEGSMQYLCSTSLKQNGQRNHCCVKGLGGVKASIMLYDGTDYPEHVLVRLIDIATRWKYQMVFSGYTHNMNIKLLE